MNYDQAQQRVYDLKRFYKNLTWFAVIALIIFCNDVFENGKINLSLFNGSIILTIWGIILIIKAVKLFVLNPDWERKVIQDEMRKSKETI